MKELLKKITFKHVSILILLIVFIYLLLKNKNENLETCVKVSEKCRKVGDTDNCCEGLVCHQNECKPIDSVKKRTKLSIEDITDLTNKFTSEIGNRGYSTAPKVEEKINESILESKIDSEIKMESESEIDSKIKMESESEIKFDTMDLDSDIDISKKMSSKLSRSCTCKCDNIDTDKNEPTDVVITKETIVKSSKRMGDSCTIDNECLSGKCSKEYKTCVFKLDGEDCLAGSQCVSQKCDPNTKKCVKKDMGDKCVFGSQCKSGNCNSKVNCKRDVPGDCDTICLNF